MSVSSQELGEFNRSIGRLEGKLDSMVSSVQALSSSFENLEKGRLSRLEIAFAEIKTEVNDKSRNTSFWTSAVVSVVMAVLIAFLLKQFDL